MKATLDAALADVPSVRHVLVVPRLGLEVSLQSRDVPWRDALAQQPDTFTTERTAADDPMMLIYTSGTTGKPKGAVHSHCGFPIKAAQDMVHCFDVHCPRRAGQGLWHRQGATGGEGR